MKDKYDLKSTILIQTSREETLKRILERKREDDSIEIFNKRMNTYIKETSTIFNDLKKLGEFIEVNGEGEIKKVQDNILKKITKLI